MILDEWYYNPISEKLSLKSEDPYNDQKYYYIAAEKGKYITNILTGANVLTHFIPAVDLEYWEELPLDINN